MQQISDAYAPLSAWDELPIHQTVAPIRYVDTADPRAFERYWFTAQPRDASFIFVLGIGIYPNIGVADAYALLTRDGQQVTLRAQRTLSADRSALCVGPISADPVAAFAEWHLVVGDNEQSLSCDLRWRDTKRASFRKMDFTRIPGMPYEMMLEHNWGGYETFGTIEGWIEHRGKRMELTPDQTIGSRDHHWGIRDRVGGFELVRNKKRRSHCGQWVEFASWALWGDRVLYNIGADGRGPAFAEPLEHRISFDPVTRHFREAIISNRLANGQVRTLHYRRAGDITAYMRCAGYSGPDGRGTPSGNHHHGENLGSAITGEIFNISEPAVQMEIAGFEDHLCFVECDGEQTVGILECCNPALYDMCTEKLPGFSFLETAAK
jgi:hypothetical protein